MALDIFLFITYNKAIDTGMCPMSNTKEQQ